MTMKRRHIFYFICISGLLILIAGAFLVPQLIFATQDNFRERNISLEKRENLDITKLNLTYEKSLSKRMTSFSQGIAQGKKYYVAATSYGVGEGYADNEEMNSIAQSMIYQNITILLFDMGFAPEDILKGWDYENVTQNWKRYVIYDEDFQNGAALMAWYMDWQMDGGVRLRLLADTETGTIYFAKADYPEEMKTYIQDCMADITFSVDYAYYLDNIINVDYETDKANQSSEYWKESVMYSELYGKENKSINYGAEIEKVIMQREEFFNNYEPQEYVLEVPLSYSGNVLNFKMEYLEQENKLVVGVTEIGGLIPDFAD